MLDVKGGKGKENKSKSGASGLDTLVDVGKKAAYVADGGKTFKTLQTNIANYQLRGQVTDQQLDRYDDMIESAYGKGLITSAQRKQLLAML